MVFQYVKSDRNLVEPCEEQGFRLAITAVVATLVLEMMMLVGAPNILGIPPMNPANLITTILGLPQGHIFGTVVHFGLGLIAFPIGYMIIAYEHFPGPYTLRRALGCFVVAGGDGRHRTAGRQAHL